MVGRSLRVAVCGDGADAGSLVARLDGTVSGALSDQPGVQRPSFSVESRATELVAASHHLVVWAGPVPASSPWVDVSITRDAEAEELAIVRLAPWAAKWHNGRRAPRTQVALQVEPDPTWAAAAARLVSRLRNVTEATALRIDHIGSTSVPGLPAKDLIDIQVIVPASRDAPAVAEAATRAGFVRVPGEWFGLDRFGQKHAEEVVVDADPGRPANVNIRAAEAPVGRETVLYRDWLRANADGRERYAAMKAELVGPTGRQVDDYSRRKEPFIAAALAEAEAWATATRWQP